MSWCSRLTVVCVMLVVAVACGRDEQATNPPGVTADGEIDVAALVTFVEETRNREFSSEPMVTFVDQIGANAPGAAWGSRDWDVLRLTGIIPVDSDRDAANSVASQGISGFCCPVSVVRLDDPVATASVAVHELVHLLDRDLTKLPAAPPPLFDRAHTIAIVEGNAARVQELFLRAHGRDLEWVQAQVEVPPEMPLGLVEFILVSYVSGAELSSQIVEQGGEPAMDGAYGRNPSSAEQVMFPSAYFDNDASVEAAAPVLVEGSSPLQTGTLGTFVLGFMVGDDRFDALGEWSGDSYALWENGDQVCLTAEIVMDTPDAASRLATALAETTPDMTVLVASERVTIERCLPTS